MLVTFYLLASTATAYAECAWVFWEEGAHPPSYESFTRLVSAWNTKDACDQALTRKISSSIELYLKDKNTEVTVDHVSGRPRVWLKSRSRPDLITTTTYVCLPDTVDPRDPKGK
jgi:hypothetical protein